MQNITQADERHQQNKKLLKYSLNPHRALLSHSLSSLKVLHEGSPLQSQNLV